MIVIKSHCTKKLTTEKAVLTLLHSSVLLLGGNQFQSLL